MNKKIIKPQKLTINAGGLLQFQETLRAFESLAFVFGRICKM